MRSHTKINHKKNNHSIDRATDLARELLDSRFNQDVKIEEIEASIEELKAEPDDNGNGRIFLQRLLHGNPRYPFHSEYYDNVDDDEEVTQTLLTLLQLHDEPIPDTDLMERTVKANIEFTPDEIEAMRDLMNHPIGETTNLRRIDTIDTIDPMRVAISEIETPKISLSLLEEARIAARQDLEKFNEIIDDSIASIREQWLGLSGDIDLITGVKPPEIIENTTKLFDKAKFKKKHNLVL